MIIGIWKTNQTLKITHKLFILQCSTGLLLSLGFLLNYVLSYSELIENLNIQTCLHLDSAFRSTTKTLFLLEPLILCNIIVNRFIAIRTPLIRRKNHIILLWFVVSFTAVAVSGYFSERSYEETMKFGAIQSTIVSIAYFLLLVFMVGTNSYLLIWLRRYTQKGKNGIDNSISRNNQRYGIVTILIMTITTFVFALPFVVLTIVIVVNISMEHYDVASDVSYDAMGLAYLSYWFSMGVNSHIYCQRSKQIYKYHKKLFSRIKHNICSQTVNLHLRAKSNTDTTMG